MKVLSAAGAREHRAEISANGLSVGFTCRLSYAIRRPLPAGSPPARDKEDRPGSTKGYLRIDPDRRDQGIPLRQAHSRPEAHPVLPPGVPRQSARVSTFKVLEDSITLKKR